MTSATQALQEVCIASASVKAYDLVPLSLAIVQWLQLQYDKAGVADHAAVLAQA